MPSSAIHATQASDNYLPALDGLRAVSILLVVLSHAGLERVVPGGLGVTIFFVISGFLLTRQMIAEIEATGNLNVKQFYLRRAFRLAPALLVYIGLFTAILFALGIAIAPVQILSGIFYFANYYYIFAGYPPHSPMPILWSLSVEEHYYILFPFCMLAFRRNLRAIMPWLYGAVALALIWRLIISDTCGTDAWALCGLPGKERFFGTDMIFDCILYGAIIALALHYYSDTVRRVLINPTAFALAGAVLLLSLVIRDAFFRETLRFTLQASGIAVAVINILYGSWAAPRAILSCKTGILIGRMSYALYLFHYGVLVLMNLDNGLAPGKIMKPADAAIYLTASFAGAAVCYFLVEKPMVRVRKRFGARQRA